MLRLLRLFLLPFCPSLVATKQEGLSICSQFIRYAFATLLLLFGLLGATYGRTYILSLLYLLKAVYTAQVAPSRPNKYLVTDGQKDELMVE